MRGAGRGTPRPSGAPTTVRRHRPRRRGALAHGRDGAGRAVDRPSDRSQWRARAAARTLRGTARVSRAVASGPRSLTPVPGLGGRAGGRCAAGRARSRGPATGGQRGRQPPLSRACGSAACARLSPRAGDASKAAAVAFHRQVRGYAREQTLAVGDSREDLACAEHVGSFWLVANAVERDPSIREVAATFDNVRVADAGHGAGVYEAVVSTPRHSMMPSRFSSS